MEIMISREVITIQLKYYTIIEFKVTLKEWAQGLVIKLINVTHGQWIYRNVHVHDKVTGVHSTQRKEEWGKEIMDPLDIGEDGLEE